MKTIFVGSDPRSMLSAWVCMSSITRHARKTVALVPLIGEQTSITRRGLTSFTFARYAAPYMCGFKGQSIFMDSDIIVRDNIHKLFDLADPEAAVSVVMKNEVFERPAVMVFNNELCKKLSPEYINNEKNVLQDFSWANKVGKLPQSWGFLVDYDEPTREEPSLIHYTSGTPGFLECRNVDYADLWYEERDQMLSTCSWLELMGRSVHTQRVTQRMKWNEFNYLSNIS